MKILVVDEFPRIAELLKKHLEMAQERQQVVGPLRTAAEKPPTIIEIESNYDRAQSTLEDEYTYDVVIIDPRPQEKPELGMQIVRQLKGTRVITIAFPTRERVQDCVECMRAGAWDYIPKGANMSALAQSLLASLAYAFEARFPVEDADAAFVGGTFDALAGRYPGQWVAIGGGKFLGAAETYAELEQEIAAMPGAPPKFWRMPPRWPEEEQ